jgi:hypothetical protein
LRWLGLTVLACALAPLAGCHLLNLLPARHDNKADGIKIDTVKTPAEASAANLPGKCQYRVAQFLFLADFEINRDLPLFKELAELPEQLHKTLQLPASNNLVQVYLFEDRDRYERFLEARHPDLPKRRAFFIAQPRPIGGEELLVYLYWGDGDRIQQDLRHELTHALLHSVLKDVPLWLDEGLAEYFELPPAKNGMNSEHLKYLRHGPGSPLHSDLNRLEQLKLVEQMTPGEYRESWAWVHLLLHSSADARKVLVGYLKELRSTSTPGPMRPRLSAIFPTPESALERHLLLIDTKQRPGLASN